MKLKKILASLTAAALAVTTMAFAPLSVSAADMVDYTVHFDKSIGNVILQTNGDYKVAGVDKTVTGWWGQIDKEGTDYTAAFGTSDVDGCTGTFSFSADSALDEIRMTAVYWDNDTSSSYAYELSVKSASPEIKVIANGKPAKDKTNDWYYLVPAVSSEVARVNYVETVIKPEDTYSGDIVLTKGVDFDADSLTENAKLRVYFKTGAGVETEQGNSVTAGWGIGKIGAGTNDTWWKDSNEAASISSTGPNSTGYTDVKFSKFVLIDSNYEVIGCQTYEKTSNITKVSILDTSAVVLPVPATSVNVTPDTATLKIGETADLTAEVLPADTTDTITWSSSDDTVATVDENGKVTAVAAGTATITAKANDTVSGTCKVTVEKNTYAITVATNDAAYGTASADKTEAAEGEEITLTAKYADGYKFVEWKSDDVTITNNKFTMPAKAVTVTAVFAVKEPDEFDIAVSKTANGTVTVKDNITAAVKGKNIELIVTPAKGYELDTLTVNGTAIEGTSFVMPEANVTVAATFKKSAYTVTVTSSEGGKAEADKTTAQMGDTVKITATPANGYKLSSITVNGTAITGASFEMSAENAAVVVTFKSEGSSDVEIKAPEGVKIGFTGSKDDVLKAVFGEDYAKLVDAGYRLDVVMTVKDESAVSADDIALIKGALADGQKTGLILDVALVKTMNGVSANVSETANYVSFSLSVPDDIIADGRTYSVIRIHDGKAENIGGKFDSESKTITVSSKLFSAYAIVYEEAAKPKPQPEPVKYYSIVTDRNASVSTASAAAGTVVYVKAEFGYDANVYCGNQKIATITESGSFKMPAGSVRIVCSDNGYLSMIKSAAPNSYIFVYDSEMNYIKTNGSVKGIKGEGTVTVKLGEEYAGKTVTLYKGRKSTSVKLESKTLNSNGNATFTVEGGKNYTAVVE
ncbi:MAG: Ig-like domain-containing protein [Oscillospiraceae bacterium]|nr:Ig-like domain-containing protein [Oscillospiraceae bacterium]